MNRFRDLSGNQNSRRPSNFRRDESNNRFKSSSRFSSNNRVNLPTNNRWKRDEAPPSNNTGRNFNRRPTHLRKYNTLPNPNNLEPHELNSKFVDVKSMAIGFEQITSKPKQNKKKKKKKKNNIQEENNNLTHQTQLHNQKQTVKKYSKKYELSNDEDDLLNASIINQYNYEVIEESEEEETKEED
jgi:hypothetical protein